MHESPFCCLVNLEQAVLIPYSSQFRLPIYHTARKTPGEKNHLVLRPLVHEAVH